MSMHMIRGVQVHGSGRKKKKAKTAGVIAAEKALAETLARVGYKGSSGRMKVSVNKLPNLREGLENPVKLSDRVCSSGLAKEASKYTGDEIAGIVVTHKSNLMPIRKDNKTAAVDAASMRR